MLKKLPRSQNRKYDNAKYIIVEKGNENCTFLCLLKWLDLYNVNKFITFCGKFIFLEITL